MLQLRRQEKNLAIRRCRSSSREKRPSNLKEIEKCVDTRKWVQVNIAHLPQDLESLNIAAQMLATTLNSLVVQQPGNKNLKATNKDKSSERKREKTHLCDRFSHPHASSQPAEPAIAYPAVQGANSSYVGMVLEALQDVDRHQITLRRRHPSSSLPVVVPDPQSSESDNDLSNPILGDPEFDEVVQSRDSSLPVRPEAR